MNLYILGGPDGKQPIRVESMLEWEQWFARADRVVAQEVVNGFTISTVFLGIDHGFGRSGPILFESVIFSPEDDDVAGQRYATWDAALAGHLELSDLVRGWNEQAGKLTAAALREVAKTVRK